MDAVDVGSARLAWDVLQTVFMAIIGVYLWWVNRTRATTNAITQVDGRVTELAGQVDKLEQTVASRPKHGDVNELRNEIAQTNRQLSKVSAELHATTELLGTVHRFLLNDKGPNR